MAQWMEDSALARAIVDNLVYASSRISRLLLHTDVLTTEFNMPMSSIQLLLAVEENPYTVGELADFLGVHKPNVAPIVNALEASGMIERKTSPEDHRKIYISLLPKGEKLCQDMRKRVCLLLRDENKIGSATEAKNLNKAIGTLIRTMKMDKK